MNPDKIVRIHRGADTHYFNPERVSVKQVSDVFNQFQIPLGLPVISLVGRLSIWKGHTVLLKALSMMRNKEVVCLFIGSKGGSTLMSEIKRQIDLLPQETRVQIIETCSDMPAAYALSDIVVSASTEPETFGRVAVEAGAGTDCGGLESWRFLRNGCGWQNGLFGAAVRSKSFGG